MMGFRRMEIRFGKTEDMTGRKDTDSPHCQQIRTARSNAHGVEYAASQNLLFNQKVECFHLRLRLNQRIPEFLVLEF